MTTRRWILATFPLLVFASFMIAGCGGGGSSGGDAEDDLSDLALIDLNVGGTDGVALNKIIALEFSEEVVNSSVTPETVRIRMSPANAWQVPGSYYVDGNIIEFFPRLPVAADLSDAGLVPGATYEVHLPGGAGQTNTLTNGDGDPLVETTRITFATAVAGSPNLFIDYDPDEQPHVIAVNPRDMAVDVPQAVVPELNFSEPLHPATVTTGNISLTMTHRPPGHPLDPQRPIQGHLLFTQSRESVVVKFESDFPLADNATYALVVNRRVSDLAGNDLIAFESSFTIRDEPPVPGVFTLDFGPGTETWEDTDVTIASWNDDIPEVLCAIFTAGAGDGTDGDFEPTLNTTLSSDQQTTYNFRKFKIPAGVTLTLRGEKPVTILSLARIEIAGTLLASGAAGTSGETHSYNSAVPKTPGGRGGPGGGDGGDAATKPKQNISSRNGEDGWLAPGTGAKAGTWPSGTYSYVPGGGGGAGGGHRTAGANGAKSPYTYYSCPTAAKGGGTGGNMYCDPLTGGGGGSAGTVSGVRMSGTNIQQANGGAAGGGGGGGLELRSANNIEILGGKILAEGGAGGQSGSTYMSTSGGGGAGGALLIKTLKDLIAANAEISVKGGPAQTSGYYTYYIGKAGKGGDGWIRLEDGDGSPTLSQTTIDPSTRTTGTFTASGAGAPSLGQTLWLNLGVFDPTFLTCEIVQEIAKAGQTITVEIQGAPEDIFDFGMPDEDLASPWTDVADLTSLNGNGYSYIRLRVTFMLADDQELDDPMPFVDLIRIRYTY